MGSGPALDQWGRSPTDPNYGKPPTTATGTSLTPSASNPWGYMQGANNPSQTDESNPYLAPTPANSSNTGFTQIGPLVPAPGVAVGGNYYPPGASLNQPAPPMDNVVGGVKVPAQAPTTTTPSTPAGGVQPKPLGPAPGGYDPVKWADPTHNNSKYVIGRLVTQYDASTPEGYNALVAAIKQYAPNAVINGDVIESGLPEGPGAVDFIRDFGPGGANGPAWIGLNDQPAGTGAAPSVATTAPTTGGLDANPSAPSPVAGGNTPTGESSSSSSSASTSGVPGLSFSGPTSSGLKSLLEQKLQERISQSLNINPNDPIIRNQVEAFSGQQQNALNNYLAQVAEQQGPMGNISAEKRLGYEQVGQNTSGFQATLMANELKARRDEIQNALVQTQAYITDEEKMALEQQLAQLDNALQYARLAEQKSEFGQNLAQNESQFGRNLSQQAWLANLENAFKYAQLGQQGYQFDVTRQDNLLG